MTLVLVCRLGDDTVFSGVFGVAGRLGGGSVFVGLPGFLTTGAP